MSTYRLKLCKDCRWSLPNKYRADHLYCYNPRAVSKSALALSYFEEKGVDCYSERASILFSHCGLKGKFWEINSIPPSST